MPETIECDSDPTFTSSFWVNLFRLYGTEFNFSSAYHPQTDGQTEVVNHTIEMYLRCLTSDRPKDWVSWLPWVEYCYNTSYHSSIKATPFEVVYGRSPPSLLSYVPGSTKVDAVDQALQDRDAFLKVVRQRLLQAQERMKRVYDQKHREVELEVDDWVYLKLQAYRLAQCSISYSFSKDREIQEQINLIFLWSQANNPFSLQSHNIIPIDMRSGSLIQAWIEFDGNELGMNVTVAPTGVSRLSKPLISFYSPVIANFVAPTMFVGFSASKSTWEETWRVLAWSLTDQGVGRDINTSNLSIFPPESSSNSSSSSSSFPSLSSGSIAGILQF
ncbi:hypothetical protein F0562_034268 [Nyssa sinensis]|uniref:Integrase catalytic domain-containing protein n=1 Tax=Nyssa sinensis TaxID=561372 RepID=A0A5J5AIC4_9ASTE|nr:hypothetical protein F0562_034268 [Nyssa sinensis]